MSKSAFETLVNIETQDIEWLWWPYIPYGMTTIVDGDPNVGKSFFVAHLAAAVSSGGKILSGKRVPKGKVLYFSAEDDPACTIRPRLDAMGGNARRVRVQLDYMPLDEEGVKEARREVRSWQPDLIIVDPLYAYVGSGTDIFRSNEISNLFSSD